MAARVGTRTRPLAALAGAPPSSAERSPRPPADEDDGRGDSREGRFVGWEDDDWPGPWGAARLGIP